MLHEDLGGGFQYLSTVLTRAKIEGPCGARLRNSKGLQGARSQCESEKEKCLNN